METSPTAVAPADVAPQGAAPRRFRLLYLCLGWLCVGLGVIGAVLPVMPTTPFLLVALWAFSRSSQRFHDWLYHHPRFGPTLRAWRRHRVIPARAKLTALAAMVASLTYVSFFVAESWILPAVIAAFMSMPAAFILSCPSSVPAETES
ncbi:YbaN family protein [Telmatospirillum sp. J64-1]|uniref:YbaN family protein n=1 Tax=Telmatospirillum sp. J64-1 TaxID=2502183 RepID=UPI00115D9045|nr:YbaN family protein [Telmatospirillum sp. J64-1]